MIVAPAERSPPGRAYGLDPITAHHHGAVFDRGPPSVDDPAWAIAIAAGRAGEDAWNMAGRWLGMVQLPLDELLASA